MSSAAACQFTKALLWNLSQDVRRCGFHLLANTLLGSTLVPRPLRVLGYRCLGMQVSLSANIFPLVYFATRNVSIGADAAINSHVRFENAAHVTVGDNAGIGPGASFVTSTHEFGPSARRVGEVRRGPIVIGPGAWIGADARVLPGLTVGRGAVVAAGAVVTKAVSDDVLVAGVPAREVKRL